MYITHGTTRRSVAIMPDLLVDSPEGRLVVEAMFSKVVDLSSPSVDLAARLHPTKAEVFEWIVSGQCSVSFEGKPIVVPPDVQLYVNRPQGGFAVRHFSEFLLGPASGMIPVMRFA